MKIQRYIARDMRNALAQVREALGPDAVILSSGRIGDDVEVVAAVDFEVARAVESAPQAMRAPAPRVESRAASGGRAARGRRAGRARRATPAPPKRPASVAPPHNFPNRSRRWRPPRRFRTAPAPAPKRSPMK